MFELHFKDNKHKNKLTESYKLKRSHEADLLWCNLVA